MLGQYKYLVAKSVFYCAQDSLFIFRLKVPMTCWACLAWVSYSRGDSNNQQGTETILSRARCVDGSFVLQRLLKEESCSLPSQEDQHKKMPFPLMESPGLEQRLKSGFGTETTKWQWFSRYFGGICWTLGLLLTSQDTRRLKNNFLVKMITINVKACLFIITRNWQLWIWFAIHNRQV